MHLLNTTTLRLRNFIGAAPPYVILSHTWGEDEVSYDDIDKPREELQLMTGYDKIRRCCGQAKDDGYEWVWIDTCCIDKRSSAELSEAINSMYQWYWNAEICYAYLVDVTKDPLLDGNDASFGASRWFSRGWTLQELLASETVEFYDCDWRILGTKLSLLNSIRKASQIDMKYLLKRELIKEASVATIFSWASHRQTTRSEDIAYCLLGLVSINMPMLYGEGDRAFYRLQLEIVRQSDDHTIFAWETARGSRSEGWHGNCGSILASSPECFHSSAGVFTLSVDNKQSEARYLTHEVVNSRLRIMLPTISSSETEIVALLNCADESKRFIGICLKRSSGGSFTRQLAAPLVFLSVDQAKRSGATNPISLLIEASVPSVSRNMNHRKECSMRIEFLDSGIPPSAKLAVPGYSHELPTFDLRHRRSLDIENAQFACFNLEVGFATVGLMDNQPVLYFTKKTASFPCYVNTLQQDLLGGTGHLQTNRTIFYSDKAEMTKVHCGSKGWCREHVLLTSKKMRIASRLWWIVKLTTRVIPLAAHHLSLEDSTDR